MFIDKWSVASRIFHWGGALLLLITWAMIALSNNVAGDGGDSYLLWHKAFGFSLLCWTLARIINRLLSSAPKPIAMPIWQQSVAKLTHVLLYSLLLAMPISGILMNAYGGRALNLFGLFDIPAWVTPDRTQARFFNNLHTQIFWPAILLLTATHIGAAIYHQWVVKDGLLARMK